MPAGIASGEGTCYTPAQVLSVGERVRAFRKAKKFTQKMLADRAGLYHTTISELERSVTKPSLDTIQKIADALDIEVHALIVNGNGPSSTAKK